MPGSAVPVHSARQSVLVGVPKKAHQRLPLQNTRSSGIPCGFLYGLTVPLARYISSGIEEDGLYEVWSESGVYSQSRAILRYFYTTVIWKVAWMAEDALVVCRLKGLPSAPIRRQGLPPMVTCY
jgi:hypothetical protein